MSTTGVRAVIWFQGCTIGCPGCFNPETHSPGGGRETEVEELVGKIVGLGGSIDGVSISGGEPFQQPEGLLALVKPLTVAARKGFLSRAREQADSACWHGNSMTGANRRLGLPFDLRSAAPLRRGWA